ncbi:MAG: Asp-tRNA(Asn)/Glu-tRNA(Gln) amidotransferase subunit GatA [Candidatus Pacebacteria bacterium]|nr:Asp-tRNA(Asn)/Glu-tRNA(Gln) amidotransferase subunit GatA [Candidatus Paceibacterota bacterium]
MENTIENLHKKIISGEIKIKDLASSYVEKSKNEKLNVYREVFGDIDEQISYAEKILAEGKATALTGIPISIKDNIMFAGHIAGACSHMLDHHRAAYDSTVIKVLKEAGAIIIGRTNMDDGAMGSSTENSAYGPTLNPFDNTRVPGGSSGGSTASVAADFAVVSLGSDTGGSIRQPAAFCGVVGLLPTYGTISRHGLISMGSSLDVIGPITKTVSDAKTLYNIISVDDQFDATNIKKVDRIFDNTLKKKIAVPKGMFNQGGIDEEVKENFEKIKKEMENKGFSFTEVELPHFGDALAVYYILMPAEVSSNLARLDGIRYGERVGISQKQQDLYGDTRGALFGKEVRRRILLGTYVLSHGYYDAYYNKAVALRAIIREELEEVLKEYDAIFTPTTPTPAFKIGEKVNDPVSMYLADLFTVPANIASHPAISIPSGKTKENLPLGVQFIGPRFAEEKLFELGKVVESVRKY